MNFVKIFISATIAFFMSIIVALLIETFGGAIGSIIGTVPSTIVPAVYVILTEESMSKEARFDATLACLFGMFATDILFMPSWKYVPPLLPKKWANGSKVLATTIASLVIWFIGAIAMILFQQLMSKIGVTMFAFGIGVLVLTATCGVCLCWHLPPTPAGKNKVKWYVHLCRGLAAGIAIFISGVMSQSGAGIAAGAMITFPAIFGTTMVSVSLAQGADVSTGAIGPLMMGGMVVGWYSIIAALFYKYTRVSALWICIIAFFLSIIVWSIPIYFFIRWRRDTTTKQTAKMIAKLEQENIEIEMKNVNENDETKKVGENNDSQPDIIDNSAIISSSPVGVNCSEVLTPSPVDPVDPVDPVGPINTVNTVSPVSTTISADSVDSVESN